MNDGFVTERNEVDMSENSEGQITTEEDRDAVKQYRVRSISDSEIRDIFRHDIWDVEKGIDYLIGIYSYTPADEASAEQLVTLDGAIHTGGLGDVVIENFCKLHDRLRSIWRHSRRKDEYTPGYFIRWGLQLSDVFEISWFDDARSRGLVPDKWLTRPKPAIEAVSNEDEEKMGKEKTSMLSLIGGLYAAKYRLQENNTVSDVFRELQMAGVGLDRRTIKSHLLRATRLVKLSAYFAAS